MVLGKDTSHVPTGLKYPPNGRLEMDSDGQSRGYDMTSLQTVPSNFAGKGALSYWKRFIFQQSDRLAGKCVKEFIHIVLACRCAPNYM